MPTHVLPAECMRAIQLASIPRLGQQGTVRRDHVEPQWRLDRARARAVDVEVERQGLVGLRLPVQEQVVVEVVVAAAVVVAAVVVVVVVVEVERSGCGLDIG